MNFQDRIFKILKEAHEAYVDAEAKKELKRGKADAGYAGPIARDIASRTKGNVIKNIRDPLVRREAGQAKERAQSKLSKMAKRGGKKMPRIKMSAKHGIQSALLRRRRRNKGKGLNLPPLSRSDQRALSQREREMPEDRGSRRRR
jgi:hypothetical protein